MDAEEFSNLIIVLWVLAIAAVLVGWPECDPWHPVNW